MIVFFFNTYTTTSCLALWNKKVLFLVIFGNSLGTDHWSNLEKLSKMIIDDYLDIMIDEYMVGFCNFSVCIVYCAANFWSAGFYFCWQSILSSKQIKSNLKGNLLWFLFIHATFSSTQSSPYSFSKLNYLNWINFTWGLAFKFTFVLANDI